jgi:hypothetical protein
LEFYDLNTIETTEIESKIANERLRIRPIHILVLLLAIRVACSSEGARVCITFCHESIKRE